MVFGYYKRLTRRQQAIYRRSDEITVVRLPSAAALQPVVAQLAESLRRTSRAGTEILCQQLLTGLTRSLGIAPARVTVLARRPHNAWGELHGLYVPAEAGSQAHITVWMRTARRVQVVAFRTFLRTLVHEFGHHLDYTLLGLEESFHTEGFYKRESSLFHQLMGASGEASSGVPGVMPRGSAPS